MKKMTNRLLSLGLVLIAVAVLTIPVLAADAVVRRDVGKFLKQCRREGSFAGAGAAAY